MTTQGSSTTRKTAAKKPAAKKAAATKDDAVTANVRTSLFELFDTITGNDELLVEEKFSVDVWDLVEPFTNGGGMAVTVKIMRVMLFIEQIHNGIQPDEAYHQALGKAARELLESFDDDGEGANDESTVVGKDEPDAA